MALSKYRLGELITRVERRNEQLRYGLDDVRGVTNTKQFMPTRADVSNRNFERFLIAEPGDFVFNRRTTRMGEKIGLGFNNTERDFIFTDDYITFHVSETAKTVLLPEYLCIFFNRPEFDRYARYNSWGSATELFRWEEMCNVPITLPPLSVQRKYAAVYQSLLANQRAYESGLDDLKIACEAFIEDLRRKIGTEKIGPYIMPIDERNHGLKIRLTQGITTEKVFAMPRQVASAEKNAKIVRKGQFAYNRATTRNGEKISIAYRDAEDCVVSSAYQVFEISQKDKLLPGYLMMWFKRSEFDRYARYMSKGSAHEFFEYSDMEEVRIPIPDLSTQQSIVNIYNSCTARRELNEKLKTQLKDICPILIKGSLEEAKRKAEND